MLTDPYGANGIPKRIVGCAIRIHDVFGPGAFESVYHQYMAYELQHGEGATFHCELMPTATKRIVGCAIIRDSLKRLRSSVLRSVSFVELPLIRVLFF